MPSLTAVHCANIAGSGIENRLLSVGFRCVRSAANDRALLTEMIRTLLRDNVFFPIVVALCHRLPSCPSISSGDALIPPHPGDWLQAGLVGDLCRRFYEIWFLISACSLGLAIGEHSDDVLFQQGVVFCERNVRRVTRVDAVLNSSITALLL